MLKPGDAFYCDYYRDKGWVYEGVVKNTVSGYHQFEIWHYLHRFNAVEWKQFVEGETEGSLSVDICWPHPSKTAEQLWAQYTAWVLTNEAAT